MRTSDTPSLMVAESVVVGIKGMGFGARPLLVDEGVAGDFGGSSRTRPRQHPRSSRAC